jgi:hypothetical protein
MLQIGQSHPTGLTTNLLKLFEPRAPLEFKPPPEKRKCPPYQGMALVLLVLFWFQSVLWQCTRILALQKILTLCKKDRVLCFYHSYSNFYFVIPVHHSEEDCINQLHDFTLISELEHWSF